MTLFVAFFPWFFPHLCFFPTGGGVKACVKALASGATLSGEEVGVDGGPLSGGHGPQIVGRKVFGKSLPNQRPLRVVEDFFFEKNSDQKFVRIFC